MRGNVEKRDKVVIIYGKIYPCALVPAMSVGGGRSSCAMCL